MKDINETIKHFEGLQKRYQKQHNGKMCDRVEDALEALRAYAPTQIDETPTEDNNQAVKEETASHSESIYVGCSFGGEDYALSDDFRCYRYSDFDDDY